MERKMNKFIVIITFCCMNLIVFGLCIILPPHVGIPLLFVAQMFFMCFLIQIRPMPQHMNTIHVICILEESIRMMVFIHKRIFRKMDVIIPGLLIWFFAMYLLPWVVTQELQLPVDKSVIENIASTAQGLSDIILIILSVFVLFTIFNAIPIYLDTNAHRVRYILSKIMQMGIQVKYVHKKGKMHVDWDDLLDKLGDIKHVDATYYYSIIQKNYEHLQDFYINPFRPPFSFADMLYNVYKRNQANADENENAKSE